MSRALGRLRAGLLVAAFAVACGTDTLDLLPPGAGGSVPAAAGSDAGGSGLGGSASGGSGAMSGSSGGGLGGSGGGGGCSGLGCAGFGGADGFGGDGLGGDSGFGGDGGCEGVFCPCGPQGRCSYGLKCNARQGTCTPRCDSPFECGADGLLCENNACGVCTEDQQCKEFGGFGRRVCVEGRCEECDAMSDCPPDSPLCVARRCVQCLTNEDCPSKVCDKPRGRCMK